MQTVEAISGLSFSVAWLPCLFVWSGRTSIDITFYVRPESALHVAFSIVIISCTWTCKDRKKGYLMKIKTQRCFDPLWIGLCEVFKARACVQTSKASPRQLDRNCTVTLLVPLFLTFLVGQTVIWLCLQWACALTQAVVVMKTLQL